MPCLLIQLQQKSPLDYKTNTTHNHQEIELFGSLTTKDLKKPHSSRQVGGAEVWGWAEQSRDMVWHREVSGSGGTGNPTFMYGG